MKGRGIWTTPIGARGGLLLALYSGITPGGAQGWGARINHVQAKCPTHYTSITCSGTFMTFRLYLEEAASADLPTHPDIFLLLASSLVYSRMTMGELALEYPC